MSFSSGSLRPKPWLQLMDTGKSFKEFGKRLIIFYLHRKNSNFYIIPNYKMPFVILKETKQALKNKIAFMVSVHVPYIHMIQTHARSAKSISTHTSNKDYFNDQVVVKFKMRPWQCSNTTKESI